MIRATQATLLLMVHNAVAGALVTPKLHLFKSFSGSGAPTPADFVEPSYSGYAAVTPTYGGERIFPDGSVGDTITQAFTVTPPESGPTLGDLVNGWYLTDSTNATLKLWDRLAAPVNMIDASSGFTLLIQLRLPVTVNLGGTIAG